MDEKMVQDQLKVYCTALIDRQLIKCSYCKKIIGFRLLKNAKSRLFRKPLLEWQTFQTELWKYDVGNRCCTACYNDIKGDKK